MEHLYFYTESKLSRILFSIWILGVKIQITHSKSKINLDFMRENSNEKFKTNPDFIFSETSLKFCQKKICML